jgi:hypothetical protein
MSDVERRLPLFERKRASLSPVLSTVRPRAR